ncbi:flavin-containing monooxygenase [Microbacterium aurantiacum]|uniref:NAD(P)-binding domain-containing protein n=1 Tax=Microbacterium aurantiacum TaxID=162393 RepID=A0AAJ2HH05_9MICO|nr:NAD(P)-binding domain-containing protein [Microbacterium aurantiacum]MDS0244604.1 NAD(P)-binding domain-containing protein [Microbacterium aurantiacum]
MPASLARRRAIIVGAGQAGLAVAAALSAEGLRPQQDFVVIDAAAPGQRSWSSRWHSMVLLSDARHSALPTRRHPGDQRLHPRVDEMVDYLKVVEAGIGVETAWGVRVTGVERRGDGTTLHLSTTVGEVQTRNIVCATGAAAHPRLPEWATALSVPGVAIHTTSYQYPRQIPTRDVLIVGGGNSGLQIARELAASHTVTVAVRTRRAHRPLASYPLAAGGRRPLFGGDLRPEPVFGDSYERLQQAGVRVVPAVTDARGGAVTFADGTTASPGSVIFATGYLPGDDWLPDEARIRGPRRTTTPVPGLFVAGFPQYSRRGVDTIAGVSADATAIAHHIINRP